MQIDLVNKFNLRTVPKVLYDKATKKFKHLELKDKHELFKKLKLGFEIDQDGNDKTLFT